MGSKSSTGSKRWRFEELITNGIEGFNRWARWRDDGEMGGELDGGV
jgi:hypothetical protein